MIEIMFFAKINFSLFEEGYKDEEEYKYNNNNYNY